MNADDFRQMALSFDGAEEGSHIGAPDFRVGGRIFATLAAEGQGFGNLMLSPELQKSLVAESAGRLPADPRRLGTDGVHARPANRCEPATDAQGPPARVEPARREERQAAVPAAETGTREVELNACTLFC